MSTVTDRMNKKKNLAFLRIKHGLQHQSKQLTYKVSTSLRPTNLWRPTNQKNVRVDR